MKAINNPQKRLYFASAIILLLGLVTSATVYMLAVNAPDSGLPFEPEYSKRYLHDLELYGGKANLLADEFVRWLAGFWQGKSLAYTIGYITILISFGVFFAAKNYPFDLESACTDENNAGKTD